MDYVPGMDNALKYALILAACSFALRNLFELARGLFPKATRKLTEHIAVTELGPPAPRGRKIKPGEEHGGRAPGKPY